MKLQQLKWSLPSAIWLLLATTGGVTADEKPNVVIILADDMGYGDIHALNPDSRIPTPHLDQLAAQGVTFRDAHSASAVCTPTRYSLLTGRYSWRTPMKRGVLGGYSKPMLKSDRATIGTLMQRAGYHTGAVGKWHLGMDMPLKKSDANIKQWQGDPGIDFAGVISDSPIHHGFDYYFGVSASLDMAPYVFIRNDRFTALPTTQQPGVPFPHFIRKGPRAEDFVIDQVLDRLVGEAVGFIDEQSKKPEPYFLYVPFTAPHKPTQPNKKFRGTTELGEYGDFIAQVDDAVGQILAAVDAADRAQQTETCVVFTSDNGSYMFRYDDETKPDHTDDEKIQGFRAANHRANGPWRGTKADIYEAGHHVPFFVRWPGVLPAGASVDQPICQVDLFATCAEIVNQPLADDEGEDSFSILDIALGKKANRPAPIIHQSGSGMLALRNADWKLIAGTGSGGRQKPKGQADKKPFQLFNIKRDPAESSNVASQEKEIVASLSRELETLRSAKGSREKYTSAMPEQN